MKLATKTCSPFILPTVFTAFLLPALAQDISPAPTAVKVEREEALPHLSGDSLRATLLRVIYPPGGSSKPHTHPCPVVGYVLEGAVRMGIGDAPSVVYKRGDTFYEMPGQEHTVSANASTTRRAVFLAYFVCDKQVELSQPIVPTERGVVHSEHK